MPFRSHALAWTRTYGKGCGFYTARSNREDVWEDVRFQKHMLGGLRYALGLEDAAIPNEAK